MPAVLGNRWFIIGAVWLTLASRATAEAIPLAVEQGHCECVLATPQPSDQFYLIVGSLAEASRPIQINLHAAPASGPEFIPLEKTTPSPAWKNRVAAQARLLEMQRRQRPALDRFPPLNSPPSVKTFHLFTGERDLQNPASYQAVEADLHAVGHFVQVYLDRNDRSMTGIDGTIREVLRVFDEDIYPWAEKSLGQVLDVDRDGRFTILLTTKLSGLQKGKVQVDGFVRGSDFYRDLPAPYSNQCDMLYLNAAVKPGRHLRTVMAHEYTHAVTFCEHALTAYQQGPSNQDEESWLNEGLSHLLENPHEFGWTNLDYRISAFLARPEQYPLIVPDYFGAGMWRDPGTRGATYLFLRSCQMHADGELAKRLIQSPLRGLANLEVAAQKPFADLFRQAAVDLLSPEYYGYLDHNRKGPVLCGPRYQEIALHGASATCNLAGTAAAFFLLHSPAGDHARLQVEATGPMQVTLVPLPQSAPRLSLRWVHSSGKIQLEVTAHHGDVWLKGAAWEQAKGQQLAGNSLAPGKERIDEFFGRDRLQANTHITSAPLSLPAGHPTEEWFKILGEDDQRRPVAAWIAWP